MKIFTKLTVIVFILLSFQFAESQNVNFRGFELTGKNQETIQINQTFNQSTELIPFDSRVSAIFGLAIKASITFNDEKSLVRIILTDKNGDEYLVYETYPLLEESSSISIDNLCEETGILTGVKPQSLKIELSDASISIRNITYSTSPEQGVDLEKTKKEKKDLQNNRKINQINRSINAKGLAWAAGETEVSALSYAQKKKLFGQSTFPAGIEYYVGGIIQSGDGLTLKSASSTGMAEEWDWRSRHGKNWVTEVKNQSSCGSCWAFAATGATEALVNLFYNQPLNMNLSEQNLLSCSGAGGCSGGYPSIALDYIKNTGIINEAAFPYSATDQSCTNKSSNPTDQFKIGGRVDFGSSAYPVSEDNLKKMMIKYGPVSGGLLDWSHAMTLVGWKVVNEGDRFYYRNLNKVTVWYTVPAGSTLIGKTVWIFKNSWGGTWGDAGYVYVETNITNFAWTHALVAPVQSLQQNYSVQCADNDKDGYYWWGVGSKPANCPSCPDTPDGNDADATLGPLDAYGNCIPLNSTPSAPIADFTSDQTIINENTTVNFTDISANSPVAWAWTFEGGTPSTSTAANPVVTYKTAGKYNVTLVVTNAYGYNTKTKTGYITVNTYVPVYCTSKGTALTEWIGQVSMNGSTFASNSTGSTGYADLTANIFNVSANSNYNITLTPNYSGKVSSWGWSVWIDFNNDSDFDDAGEQVLTVSKVKTAVTKNISIPSAAITGKTRMRVSMKRNLIPEACENFSNGEVKDYSVNISVAASETLSLKSAEIGKPEINQPVSFTLFPNPVENILNLKVEEVSFKDTYSIFNLQGALISRNTINSNLTQIDVSNLPSGIYIVNVENGTQSYKSKFIKNR
ncbi:MAG: hypothetical protein A2066_14080 [Bacteroidetes bacterium GWB2_41_8]|nr:MAG: hypothetical protein A2066_14080 [Bacteroidetes bacterium GWB2_41_8]